MRMTSYEARWDRVPERMEKLSPKQKFVLDIFMTATRQGHVVFLPEVIIDIVQGIPEQFLTYPVARLASWQALTSSLGRFEDAKGELVEVTTPEQR